MTHLKSQHENFSGAYLLQSKRNVMLFHTIWKKKLVETSSVSG